MTVTAPADVVPVHAERTADPRTLRWYVGRDAAGVLDAGRVASHGGPAPAGLSALVDAGVLAGVEVGADHVATTLAGGRSWADDAPAVRAAVQETVRAGRRTLADAAPAVRDAVLARAAREVIADLVAPTASAHGGAVELVEAADGVVTVRMRGACHRCPAAEATLRGRLERGLRSRLPWFAGVRVLGERTSRRSGRGGTRTQRLLPWAGQVGCGEVGAASAATA